MDAATLEGLLQLVAYAVTWLGAGAVLLPAALAILWTADRAGGRLLLVALGVSYAVNHLLKDLLGLPRPFELDPGLALEAARATAHGSSWPSGHAQAATVFWLLLALRVRRAGVRGGAVWGVAAAAIALVAASRVVLGVHFVVDVAGGVLVGGALAALAARLPAERPAGWVRGACVAAGFGAALAGPRYGLPLGIAAGAFLARPPRAIPGRGRRTLLVAGGLGAAAAAYLLLAPRVEQLAAGGVALPAWQGYLAVAALTWLLAEAWPALAARLPRGPRPAQGSAA